MESSALVERFPETAVRARSSGGVSNDANYVFVAEALRSRGVTGTLLDVGCGNGNLWPFVRELFVRYVGVDAVRYEGFPQDGSFVSGNLDLALNLPTESAEAVVAVEVIEHLENPRAFMRELVRVTKKDGWIVVTTPNQLSLLSLLTLVAKKRFNAFQDVHYPAHLTALLEVDLIRIAQECGIGNIMIGYNHYGRLILTPWHYPKIVARTFPRWLSDNLLIMGKKQAA
jgi:SAM-dependent methyltransferase